MNLIVFDMDGVLVDVTGSYRAAIQATVARFTGLEVSNETIQEYKNRGGFNDDWVLSHRLIADRGLDIPYEDVVEYFQSIFLGGLILKERWHAKPGLLQRLARHATLAIFTGRLRSEAQLTLDRFCPHLFAEIVGVDDVIEPKPAPEGLLKLKARVDHQRAWYIGDSIDDARAALDIGMPFIGIASLNSPDREALVRILKTHGAVAVLEDINQLEEIVHP